MATIRQLPQHVVNKIAAGEVIERPASIVKELVENSLDAGARRIEVALEQGGLELVRVVDDGHGVSAEQLPLAVASHATSKLASADDLFCVRTLGFRGEALASIAAVSHFTIRSRTNSDAAGAELEVVTGEVRPVAPCGCPVGTIVEVRNLFVNTPVRRKFLRSTQTEMGHVSEAFTRLALASPQVHFVLRHNGRVVFDLPPAPEWRERIAAFFGAELSESLIWIESADPPIRLAGFVAHPSQSRTSARMQYLFLNGRYVRDRSLQHALGEAFRGLLLTGRYPISFLCFDMPPEMVDVNVHPTKLEVRFQDGGRLYSQLLGTIRTKFLTTDLTHALSAARAETPSNFLNTDLGSTTMSSAVTDRTAVGAAFVDWAKSTLAARGSEQASTPVSADGGAPAGLSATANWGSGDVALDLHPLPRRWEAAGGADEIEPAEETTGGELLSRPLSSVPTGGSPWSMSPAGASQVNALFAGAATTQAPGTALQIHNRYLITESAEGVLVIDQHALHERILYEQLRAKVLAGELETQNLLVPEPVDLSPAEAAAALEQRDLLGQLGLRVEAFGGGTILVSSYPAMLRDANPAQLLRDLVEVLVAGARTPERRDVLDELLHMMSCKAAVKAGDPLTSEEITALLEQRHLAQDTHHCPHGRPTALVFTREELDRQFMRI